MSHSNSYSTKIQFSRNDNSNHKKQSHLAKDTFNELTNLRSFYDDQFRQISDMINRCDDAKQEYQEQLSPITDQSTALQQEIDAIQSQIDALTNKKLEKLAQKQLMDDKSQFFKEAVANYKEQIDRIKKYIRKANLETTQLQELKSKNCELSFTYPSKRAKELSKQLASQQCVSAIFEFLVDNKQLQMQTLNKRFYEKLVPNWNIKIQLQKLPFLGKDELSTKYLDKTMPILPAIMTENPNYQQHVGSTIFPFVSQVCGTELAPKITGMLIDLPITEIHAFMKDYYVMVERIRQAKDLLEQHSR